MNEGTPGVYRMKIRFVEPRRFMLQQTRLDFHASRAQSREAFA
jgi:hypothetical protein